MRMLKIRPYEKNFNPTIKIKIGIYPFKHAYFNNEKEPRKKNILTCKPWFIQVGESKIVWH